LNRILWAAAAAMFASAAGAPPEAPADAADAAPGPDSAGALIAHARALRDDEGCLAAAPAYRVVAGMGAGEEAAQQELGECLLSIEGASAVETALFRQEGEFWLTRAAFAGNARAQRRLAMEMASPKSSLHDPKGALMWALIYDKNPTSDLYGYKALPPTLAPGLRAALEAEDRAEAEAFAAAFTPIFLARYEAPKRGGESRGPRVLRAPDGPAETRRRRPG
jgi:hypothetical protein